MVDAQAQKSPGIGGQTKKTFEQRGSCNTCRIQAKTLEMAGANKHVHQFSLRVLKIAEKYIKKKKILPANDSNKEVLASVALEEAIVIIVIWEVTSQTFLIFSRV